VGSDLLLGRCRAGSRRASGDDTTPLADLVELEQGLAAMVGAPDGPGVAWIVRHTVAAAAAR